MYRDSVSVADALDAARTIKSKGADVDRLFITHEEGKGCLQNFDSDRERALWKIQGNLQLK
jgi:hypothetical protein